ncbi:pseudouridine synthase [Sphingobium sp. CR2-8]|nr:pseudouridine synthase [Sphingobium sp. CR2-8]MEC3911510.1 pseudouridine synthase [Sphingobium sp. CR2-8]
MSPRSGDGDGKPRFDKGEPGRTSRARDDRGRTEGSAPGARPARGAGSRDATAKPHNPRSAGERTDRVRAERPKSERAGSDGFRPNGARPERSRTVRPRDNEAKIYPPRRPRGKGPTPTTNPHPAHATASDGKGEPQRIAKLLARAGVASRREIERMIEDGRIAKDGVVIDTPATLLTSLHGVTVDDVAVAAPAPTRLFLFHKPAGFLTTERDPAGRPTIYDRLPADLPRVMPIGRLDMNTEGLLLLTTDGEFKRAMELPATGVPRTYRARAFGEVSQQQLEDLFDGLEIDGIRYGAIEANLERRTGRNQWIEMTLTEGKNREVRRVLEHLDLKVNRLIRTSYGPFLLGELPVGAVEEVREHDLAYFRKSLKDAGKNKDA